jgi:hypothetical protein
MQLRPPREQSSPQMSPQSPISDQTPTKRDLTGGTTRFVCEDGKRAICILPEIAI